MSVAHFDMHHLNGRQSPAASRRILVALLLLIGVVGGNGTASARNAPLSATSIIARVAKLYGESNPHILHVERTQTEASHEGMYFAKLRGRFHRHRAQARYLYFSALKNRWYVWGIQAYDAHQHLRWLDGTLPKHL